MITSRYAYMCLYHACPADGTGRAVVLHSSLESLTEENMVATHVANHGIGILMLTSCSCGTNAGDYLSWYLLPPPSD